MYVDEIILNSIDHPTCVGYIYIYSSKDGFSNKANKF